MTNRIFRTVTLVTLLLSLSSCGLYKKYEREEIPFVDSLYRRMAVPNDSLSTAAISWDKIFTDSLLQEWIRLGIDFNTDLSVAGLSE